MKALDLDRTLLSQRKPRKHDLLCLDFGTAFCKAAVSTATEDPAALTLGRIAKDPQQNNRFVAQSSLFVSPELKIYFGHAATREWGRQKDLRIGRIDSMKRWLNSGPLEPLARFQVDTACLPKGASLSRADALLLILAYLTDLAGVALGQLKLSRYTPRRFSRPVWPDERASWVDRQMKDLLTRAQMVADTLSGHWSAGVDLDVAKELLRQAFAEEIPDWLVEKKAVLEPIAAGHAALARPFENRSFALVVDVGAGTTDFAGFLTAQPHRATTVTRALPQGRPLSLEKAGDYLDDELANKVLSMVPRHQRSQQVEREAVGQARLWKENLFIMGEVRPTFQGGVALDLLSAQEFIQLSGPRQFEGELSAATQKLLRSAEPLIDHLVSATQHSVGEVALVATGGGAELPMVRKLGEGVARIGRVRLPIRIRSSVPLDVNGAARANFHRLAVALGGCSPEYPEDGQAKQMVFRRGPI